MTDVKTFLNDLRRLGVRVSKRGDKLNIKAEPGALTPTLRQQLTDRKAEVLECLGRLDVLAAGDVPIVASATQQAHIPLSFSQERLWFLSQLESSSARAYNMPIAMHLTGPLCTETLARSVDWLVQRHQSLRTCFAKQGDHVCQQLVADANFFTVDKVYGLSLSAVDQLMQQAAMSAFDLTDGPLFKVQLWQYQPDGAVLLINMHHSISDGWSLGVLLSDLQHAYSMFIDGRQPTRAPLDIQFADYAIWQREHFAQQKWQSQLDYWQQHLHGAPDVLTLSIAKPRPKQQNFSGQQFSSELPHVLTQQISDFNKSHACSVFMTMLAAYSLLLSRFAREDDICIGSPIANRSHAQTHKLVGFFANTLVYRNQIDTEQTVAEYLHTIRQCCLTHFANQDMPFETLVEALKPERNLSYNPLFQVMLVVRTDEPDAFILNDLGIEPLSIDYPVAKFDLTLTIEQRAGQWVCQWEYATALFDQPALERMARHFQYLLEAMINNADCLLADLSMLSVEEQHQLAQWGRADDMYSQRLKQHKKSMVDIFERQVQCHPSACALVFEQQQWTYQQLNEQANRLARYFLSHLANDTHHQDYPKIAITVTRSIDMLVAVLATLKARAVYVPIDIHTPSERFKFIVQDSAASLIVASSEQRSVLHDIAGDYTAAIIYLEDCDYHAYSAENLVGQYRENAPAYIMYTSGSTGQPKGVCIPHDGVLRLVVQADYAALDSEQVFLQYAPVAFDASTFEIWAALLNGAKLVLMPPEEKNLASLAGYLERYQITVLWLTSSLFNTFLQEFPRALRGVKQLLVGGERLSVEHIHQALELLPSTRIVNGYGPTENTTFTCTYPILKKSLNGSIPIGKPINGTRVFVVDQHHQLLPQGVVGELLTSGDGVALGYVNREQLSQERFIWKTYFGERQRLYKTGDLVRWNDEGNLEFIGRADQQIKLRGFRIEPQEIEATLRHDNNVNDAFVHVSAAQQLIAYVASDELDEQKLRHRLAHYMAKCLPEYMRPTEIVVVATLPLTQNGKVDVKQLPQIAKGASIDEVLATATEMTLARLWADLLACEQPKASDNFFRLGGHSLLATRLILRIQEQLHVSLPVQAVFEFPYLAELAAEIDKQFNSLSIAPIQPLPDGHKQPLSYSQQRLWFIDQFERHNSTTYTIPVALSLTGCIDQTAVRASFSWLLTRHQNLRAYFVERDGQVEVKISGTTDILQVHDLRDLSSHKRDITQQQLMQEHAALTFELSTAPLIKLTLLILETDKALLLINMHHIISDGWSMDVFMRDWLSAYQAYSEHLQPSIAPLSVQYADYAAWQQDWLRGRIFDTQLAYWQQQLHQSPELLSLPTDRPRPARQSHKGGRYAQCLTAAASKQLSALCSEHMASQYMGLLAVFYIFLARYSGQQDLCVGSPIANRPHAQTQDLIGLFVNTLVLRKRIDLNDDFISVLKATRKICLSAYAHQDIPFEVLVEKLQPTRSLSHSPLFQVMFALQNNDVEGLSTPALALTFVAQDHPVAKFDLMLNIEQRGDQFICIWEYASDLFDLATIESMASQYDALVLALSDQPAQPVSQQTMMTEQAKQQLMQWNDTARSYPKALTFIDVFERQVHETPSAIALVYAQSSLDYQALDNAAKQLANRLAVLPKIAHRDGGQALIAVSLARGFDMVVALLAVLKVGAAYVPIDPQMPRSRALAILDDCCAPLILTSSTIAADTFADDCFAAYPLWCLDTLEPLAGEQRIFERKVVETDLAYVIYTSGSTGTPKGVMVNHAAMLNRLLWMQDQYGLTKNDCILQKTPFGFDVSVWEFFWPLMVGARLAIARPDGHKDPYYLAQAITDFKVSTLHFVPSMLAVFLKHVSLSTCSTLKRLFCSGEALSQECLMAFFESRERQHIALHNLYGPTEATVDVTYFQCMENALSSRPPIGRPVSNTRIFILDEYDQVMPPGVPGELVIAGVQLACGYLNRAEMTAQRFVNVTLFDRSERVYKTGDQARWLVSGELEYLGRIDNQIKLRGFRIEPGDIEMAMSRYSHIAKAHVQMREVCQQPSLVAYFTSTDALTVDTHDVKAFLKRELPDYMQPNYFVQMDDLPLTANGKLDVNNLPQPALTETSATDAKPENNKEYSPLENDLLAIWRKVLRCKTVGLHDNFFDLGGHSLLAVNLLAELNAGLSLRVHLQDLFEYPTIAELIGRIHAIEQAASVDIDINNELKQLQEDQQFNPPSINSDWLHAKRILLTGASGFLGGFLLAELLRETSATIVCLIRADDQAHAQHRLNTQLQNKPLSEWRDHPRISVLCGDLAKPNLGVSQTEFDCLAKEIDVIYHNGALVNHLYSYSVLKAANVGATQQIIRLAMTSKLKAVHYISTVGVLSAPKAQCNIRCEEDLPTDGNVLGSGYNKSKWVAEKLLMQAAQHRLPLTIYRPDAIGADSKTGIWPDKDFRHLMIYSNIALGCYPQLDTVWNIAPVDYVAKAIVFLSVQLKSIGDVFHPVSQHGIGLTQIFEHIAQMGYAMAPVDAEVWRTRLREAGYTQGDEKLRALSIFYDNAQLSQGKNMLPKINSDKTLSRLLKARITCPEMNKALLSTYLRSFEKIASTIDVA